VIKQYFAWHCQVDGGGKVGSTNNPIHCRERLGGMLNFYYREAA
jgi:hypothetical protein